MHPCVLTSCRWRGSNARSVPVVTDLAAITERLWQAREQGDFSPDWLVGQIDLDAALDLQLAMLERKLADGASLGGWKVGLTSQRARTMLGADERPFGHVLADRIIASGATLAFEEIRHPSVEPEMCFAIGSRLAGASISREEVVAGLTLAGAGFEINEQRQGSARADFPTMVTDCLTNWAIVAGSGKAPAEAGNLNDVTVRFERNGEEVFRCLGRDEVDDPIESLRRLVGVLHAHGAALEPGQRVITGAYHRLEVSPGDTFRAIFEPIGHVEVSFR